MAAVPDMSHLTPEERSTIEEVMTRHKEEEEKENEIMRRKQNEVKVLEDRIRACSEQHKKAGVELNATCHICLKTKFADGVGHICNYCRIRCCARCGGKVTLRSSKVIWVCILCRKKQELLSKTGQWMTKTGLSGAENAMPRRTSDLQVGGPPGLVDQTQDKRPKLERAHSAAEKENLPLLQGSGCLLTRQYSQQEQIPPRRLSTSDSGVEMSMSPHSRALPTPHVTVGSYSVQQAARYPGYSEDEPNIYRSEIDSLMRQYQPGYQRQRPIYTDQTDLAMAYGEPIAGLPRTTIHPVQHHSVQGPHPTHQPGQPPLQQQRSFSSSEEERSTPECPSDEPDESEKGKGYYHRMGDSTLMSSGGRRHHGSHNGHHAAGSMTIEYNGHHPPREPRKEESTVRRSFRRSGDEWRSDSRRFTERRGKKTVRFDGGTNAGGSQEDWSWEADRQGSQDSATKDSGIDTSSTFTSSEDSNRGDLPKRSLSWQSSRDGQKLIGHMVLRKQIGSGSSSNILGLKVVGGKLLEDDSVGALIEKVKKGSTADIEGQLRAGDEVIKWNGRSLQGKSFREVYDIIAASRQEPRVELVVSRNLGSMSMPGGPPPSTPLVSRRIAPQTQWRQKHEGMPGSQQPHHKELYDARREKPSVLVTSPGSPDLHAQGRARHLRQAAGNANVGGNLQVKLSYDSVALRLNVTLVCAAGLTPRSNGQPRNPYAKIFLMSDKSEQPKRRTNTLANTNDPKWNQTFLYEGIRVSELRKGALEITVWDYGRCDANDFLGEVVIDLGLAPLHEELEWHPLTTHGEHRHIGRYTEPNDMVINPVDRHLSPPSTTSRLSDSDTSECDITDCDGSREHRRTTDGASISSIGSSSRFHNMPSNYKRHYSSPPPERDFCVDTEHRSRRDMSPQSRKRAALMIREQPASISGYQTYRKEDIHRGMMGHRSYSAAPMDSPSIRYRGRSQSPTGHRSLSPPEHRSIPYSHGYGPRFSSRSATATPTGSPKKRQLPLIPAALKERAVQDVEERARFMRHRNRQVHTTYKNTGMGGWERHYSGLSDSDLPSIGHNPPSLPHSHAYRMHRPRKGHLSPDKDVFGDFGDSDMESIASVTSSAFSTQSERPRASRGLIPTVKNVLIPGVISPMPPPPRRNRRRHRLRVPCSECHCPNNNPTKPRSNNPGKHNPTPHPLVRSKSAVVRSLYRKMRTPFTRSQTVDENMLRYYSPETSEYSVSEGFILKPEELTGSSKKRIPEIYVEDCLQVDFNDRLIEKFRDKYYAPYLLDSGARRRSRSWQDRTASRSAKARQQFFARGALYDFADDLGIRNLDVSLRPRRSFLFSKARSFDYDVLHDAYADRFGARRATGTGLLSRRAKSFEYENISSNIFSDDSLRTARRKLKRNLSINDAGYGDKIPALGDRSRSYYDSNGDDKIPKSLLHQQKNYDYLLRQDHKPFYGYDSELSAGETEIYLPAFDNKSRIGLTSCLNYRSYGSRIPGETSFSSDEQIGLRDVLAREDPAKRKYIDSAYQDRDSSFERDISSEKRTRNFLDSDMSDSANEHIYCSIDEAMSAGEGYSHRDQYDRHRGAVRPRRRTKSSDSYLGGESYDGGYDWDAEYDEGFVDRGNVHEYNRRLYDYENEEDIRLSRADRSLYDDRYYHERMEDGARRTSHRKRSAQYAGDAETYIADDYSGYRSAEDYDYRTRDATPECCREAYHRDNTFPRRRRRRSRRGSRDLPSTVVYENLRPYRRDGSIRNTLSVPSFAESKRMMLQRAESTPVLPSDDDLSSNAERARRMYRRRRNSSCPESRELRYYDSPRRKDVEPSTSIMLASDEEFGSMETVVGPDYFRRKAADETRIRDGSRAVYYDAVQDRGGYLEQPQCDYEECQECIYERTRGVSRSGSLRSSGESSRYYRIRRKSSCPECRELALAAAELTRSGSLSRRVEDRRGSMVESRPRYRRRNSSCPEARDLELLERRQEQRMPQREQEGQQGPGQQPQQQQQQQGSKRNVAISDTLEYYEYSMESESQCSENCGFGPCDPRRPRNRAPRPGNANSSLFDSQTATSDTAKNYHPRAADHHENSRNTKPTPRDHHPVDDSGVDSYSPTSSTRRRSRKQSIYDDTDLPPDQQRDYDSNRDRRSSSMPESSEYSSQPGSYEKTTRHQLTDNGHDEPDKRGQFTRSLSNADGPPDEKVDGSLSDTAIGLNVDNGSRRGRKSSPGSKSGSGSSSGGGSAVQYQSGLGKKSNSTSQLSATGRKRRLGFGKKEKSSFTVHRSEEVLPEDTGSGRSGRQPSSASSDGEGSGDGDSDTPLSRGQLVGASGAAMPGERVPTPLLGHPPLHECGIGGSIVGGSLLPEPRGLGISSRKRNSTPCSIHRSEEIMPTYQLFDSSKSAGSAASDTAGSLNSISSSDGRSWSPSLRMASETGPLRNFIKDLGPGQIVGRQALGAACLGEIELSLIRKSGFLEIEVIRAKDLKNEENKAPPASYVKVYLVSGKKCIAKAKTTPARATLEPFYKQVLKLPYKDTNRGCILQVTVWSDYGRLGGRKGFMGIAQIVLDELNLEETKMGWYKLFGNTSL